MRTDSRSTGRAWPVKSQCAVASLLLFRWCSAIQPYFCPYCPYCPYFCKLNCTCRPWPLKFQHRTTAPAHSMTVSDVHRTAISHIDTSNTNMRSLHTRNRTLAFVLGVGKRGGSLQSLQSLQVHVSLAPRVHRHPGPTPKDHLEPAPFPHGPGRTGGRRCISIAGAGEGLAAAARIWPLHSTPLRAQPAPGAAHGHDQPRTALVSTAAPTTAAPGEPMYSCLGVSAVGERWSVETGGDRCPRLASSV